MIKYFKGSFLVTIVGFICAYLWGEKVHPGKGPLAIFIVFFLSVLEVTLSFDNAVINAIKLEKMTQAWRQRFLTWGIAIAVFGMRFLFPVAVVAGFSGLSLIAVTKMAMQDVNQYTHYLHLVHAPLVTFGGIFLLMLFLSYFFNPDKTTHWITHIEKPLMFGNNIKSIEVIICIIAVFTVVHIVPLEQKLSVMMAGLTGIILYLIIDSVSNFLENIAEKSQTNLTHGVAKLGFVGFLYLELIDASFSLDGVLGAFAISKDIIIITIGLAIGAMFVRSLTIFMVDKKTLKKYLYLEHGAHWAIGFLALIMLYSTVREVPEVVTGLVGLVIVGASFISSLAHNKTNGVG